MRRFAFLFHNPYSVSALSGENSRVKNGFGRRLQSRIDFRARYIGVLTEFIRLCWDGESQKGRRTGLYQVS